MVYWGGGVGGREDNRREEIWKGEKLQHGNLRLGYCRPRTKDGRDDVGRTSDEWTYADRALMPGTQFA